MKEIPLKNGGAAIVDDDVFPLVSQYSWFRAGRGKKYVIRMDGGKKWVLLARVAAGVEDKRRVTWRNGDPLDNRRENLFAADAGAVINMARGGDGVTEKQKSGALGRTREERLHARRLKKFWERVTKAGADDCWLWNGYKNSATGYGAIGWYGKGDKRSAHEYAHRVAWELEHGHAAPAGKVVRHKCDNQLCCNPAHLELGTQLDNIKDRQERGRHRVVPVRGIGPQVLALRAEGKTYAEIRDSLSCSLHIISYHIRKARELIETT
jgi:hypothetical protein